MSGNQFVDALKRIGYPSANELDGQTLDWMFDNEDLVPFLQWFCDEIQQSNVLEPSASEEYQKLELSGKGILEGEQLERALCNLSLFERDMIEMPKEKLSEEVAYLKEELHIARRRKEILMMQCNKLSLHETTMADRVAKIDVVENAESIEFRKSLEQVELDNINMNAVLDSLVPAIQQLATIYRASASGTEMERQKDCPVFLSHFDLEPYHKTEDRYSQALVAFTKKQFFEGIAEVAGQNEGSKYEFLEITNPDSFLVKGKGEEEIFDDCKELARVQSFYPINESQRINAVIEENGYAAACDFHEKMLSRLNDQPYPNDIPQLSSRLKSVQTNVTVMQKEIGQLTEQEIPALIKESASTQVAKILQGDYDLKIARQDYFTSNQDKVIHHLVTQRSRSEFLTMALEMESRSHREIQKLLLAISLFLKQTFAAFEDRLKMMDEVEKSSNQLQRTTIDSRDKFLHRLNQTLSLTTAESNEQQKKLFTTYADIEQNASKLVHQVEDFRASLQSTNQKEEDQISGLEQDLRRCESLLYPNGNLTSTGLPVLSPPSILDAMTQLDGLLNKLEEAVMDIMKDINNKKKTLQNDSLLATERELFVYFYNDADRLRRTMKDLNSRLNISKNT